MANIEDAGAPAAMENFPLAVAAGVGTAVIGAGLWAAVTVATQMELGIMAVAVGYAVGQAIRVTGHGRSQKFGILGAVCGLIGCVLGNLLSAVVFFAQYKHMEVTDVLSHATPGFLLSLMKEFTQVLDVVFYAIAIYEGYRFSFDR